MIHAPGRPDPPTSRLLAALAEHAEAVGGPNTLVVSSGTALDGPALEGVLAGWCGRGGGRALVLSVLGVHPDARAGRLRALWSIEEQVRRSGLPALVFRLAPLVGPRSPLWWRLRAHPTLPRGGELLLSPVVETDVVETLMRALGSEGEWAGWYEVAGPEALTLGELAALAQRGGARLPGDSGAWEPGLEEIAEQRLVDGSPWRERFGMAPRHVKQEAMSWA